MTTRRQALGAIIGGAAAAPQAIRQAAAASANRMPGMPMTSVTTGLLNSPPLPSPEYIADLRRLARGDITMDDLVQHPWMGGGRVNGDESQLQAMRSISTMARAVIRADRINTTARKHVIEKAIQDLISFGLQ